MYKPFWKKDGFHVSQYLNFWLSELFLGAGLTLFFIIVTSIINIVIVEKNHLSSIQTMTTDNDINYMFYTKPYCRWPVYGVGQLFAMVIIISKFVFILCYSQMKKQKKKSKKKMEIGKVCLPHGVFFCPMSFFFFSKDLLLFLTRKNFFSNFFFSKK